MKMISWNVNGLRAIHRKDGFLDFMQKQQPDMLCLQETKAHFEQLAEEIANMDGYHAYFDSPKEKKGYSGVALYTKVQPKNVVYGMGVPALDDEGRLITADYESFILITGYFPNGGGGPERLKYKLDFYDAFLEYLQALHEKQPNIIFCGDINTAHEEIDLARPKENEKNTGFLPEERAWLDEVVSQGYVDVFRHFYPSKEGSYTYWDLKTGARDRNVGWRIDYFFASQEAVKDIKGTKILSDIYGSDHCPISLEYDP